MGMPEQIKSRILEHLFTISRHSLGLAIAHQIAVEKPDRGSAFGPGNRVCYLLAGFGELFQVIPYAPDGQGPQVVAGAEGAIGSDGFGGTELEAIVVDLIYDGSN